MQCRLHELRHKRRISVAAASKILANLVYSYKGMGLSMGTMCAGVTPEEGPALYYIDSDGTRLAGNLFCVGSGQTFAYGVLDAEYRYDLTESEALQLGSRSILAATHRDAYSGGFINLYHVKEAGWVKHGFSVSVVPPRRWLISRIPIQYSGKPNSTRANSVTSLPISDDPACKTEGLMYHTCQLCHSSNHSMYIMIGALCMTFSICLDLAALAQS